MNLDCYTTMIITKKCYNKLLYITQGYKRKTNAMKDIHIHVETFYSLYVMNIASKHIFYQSCFSIKSKLAQRC